MFPPKSSSSKHDSPEHLARPNPSISFLAYTKLLAITQKWPSWWGLLDVELKIFTNAILTRMTYNQVSISYIFSDTWFVIEETDRKVVKSRQFIWLQWNFPDLHDQLSVTTLSKNLKKYKKTHLKRCVLSLFANTVRVGALQTLPSNEFQAFGPENEICIHPHWYNASLNWNYRTPSRIDYQFIIVWEIIPRWQNAEIL